MKGAFGALHWSPEIFWKCTITEYMAAIEGYNVVNGAPEKEGGPSDDELAALVAKYG